MKGARRRAERVAKRIVERYESEEGVRRTERLLKEDRRIGKPNEEFEQIRVSFYTRCIIPCGLA
jgi:hypothetical protein